MKKTRDVKIIFWGTSEFAIPSFETLFKNGYNVIAVVTNPDEPAGRQQTLTPPPMKIWITKHITQDMVKIMQPEKLDAGFKFQISHLKPDLFIIAAYGKIIPKSILEMPRCGAFGIHPSLLPWWRGPSPIQYTILNGDTETGVTIFNVDEKMDHGPVVAQRQLESAKHKAPASLSPAPTRRQGERKRDEQSTKFTYQELYDKLAKLGAELLIETLPKCIQGEVKPIPQDDAKATYSKLLKKEDGKIDWKKPAETIERQIRAFHIWPTSFSFWQKDKNQLRLEIEEATHIDQKSPIKIAGLVWQNSLYPVIVETAVGSIIVKRCKLEGKKSLSAQEFINGHRDIIGTILT